MVPTSMSEGGALFITHCVSKMEMMMMMMMIIQYLIMQCQKNIQCAEPTSSF